MHSITHTCMSSFPLYNHNEPLFLPVHAMMSSLYFFSLSECLTCSLRLLGSAATYLACSSARAVASTPSMFWCSTPASVTNLRTRGKTLRWLSLSLYNILWILDARLSTQDFCPQVVSASYKHSAKTLICLF